ncbi:MAG TPA: DUF2911 domain-containing protein [Puia sp.]|jgi:hypothetical protein|nr:DUF2911 domain-containing protein [Puia sp.]
MSKSIFLLSSLLLIGLISFAQASSHDTVKTKNLTVTYGRPTMKGRTIFGGLVPYDQVWRVGADKATVVTFEKDATFGGKPIKAGSYALFAIPTASKWTVILNSKADQWGLAHDANKAMDVLNVDVPVVALSSPVDKLTYTLSGKGIKIEWEKTSVMIPVSF